MTPGAEVRPTTSTRLIFAGLEAGIVGVIWMLAWLSLSSAWQRRSFWIPENLMATAFDSDGPIHSTFGAATISGLALYLLIYGLLGILFASAVRDRMTRWRVLLWSLAFSLAWYYASFHGIWKTAIPLLARLHVERASVLGHLVYGTLLARYPVYLERWDKKTEAVPETPSAQPVEPTQ
jgi:hypothetical protein